MKVQINHYLLGLNMAKIGDHKYVPNELEGNSDNLTFLAINRRFMEHSAMIDADNVSLPH